MSLRLARHRSLLPWVVSLGLVGLLLVSPAFSEEATPDDPVGPDPEIVIHVPVDEMDVLLEADRRGVVLRHHEYAELLREARRRARAAGLRPPEAGTLSQGNGRIDLTGDDGARVELRFEIRVLQDEGPSLVPFSFGGVALDRVDVVEGEGRYEEREGQGRLRFWGAGVRTVVVEGWAPVARSGERRIVDLRLPPAAAFGVSLVLPPGIDGEVQGEGVPLPVHTPARGATPLRVRPRRGGTLKIAWGPAARAEEGPPVLDVDTGTVHGLEDGLIRSRVLVRTDVLRTPTSRIVMRVPPETAFRAVGGEGVTGTSRSADRSRLFVQLDQPRRGRIDITLDAETAYRPEKGVELPRVVVENAVRHRGHVGVRVGREVEAQAIRVESGRRLAALRRKDGAVVLRYALARADGRLLVDLVPGDVELEAASTYYLNLTEPAKSLVAAITYRVRQGTAFDLAPRFPPEYTLRNLHINGRADGFRRDPRPDGTIELRLDRGVPEGGEIALIATLEEAGVDWVPERGTVSVPFPVPSAGAMREEGFVGVGADASFRVLDAGIEDLVSVGAAQLTARGVTPAGLVYGYRLDGSAPAVALQVTRRMPRIEGVVVARARPLPRRLAVAATVLHRIERAGIRRLEVDVPAWARDTVRIDAPDLLNANRMEGETDAPEGFDRWEVALARRVLGRHVLVVRYYEDQDEADWSVAADRPVAVRLPLARGERHVVVERAAGLEVDLEGDVRTGHLADLPREALVNALRVREIVRLEGDGEGPGIRVRKHDGAGVLDAIAPLVTLETAVAQAGIFRTRANVRLVNVGLQFLRVSLPPASELVGAVVDGESVKPLTDAAGVLFIPVPPSREPGQVIEARLTYETHRGENVGRTVDIAAPTFPGLEVLRTRHEVAFDPSLRIERVEGAYGAVTRPRRAARKPWLAYLVAAPLASFKSLAADQSAPGAGLSEPTGAVAASADPKARASGEEGVTIARRIQARKSQLDALVALAATGDQFRRDLSHAQVEELKREVARLEAYYATSRREHRGDEDDTSAMDAPFEETMGAESGAPGRREPSDPTPPPVPQAPVPEPMPGVAVVADPALAADAGAGAGAPMPRRAGGGPVPGVEGPGRPRPVRVPPALPRRKGLLSLDVPVLLSSNRVAGERLGGGGTMRVAVVSEEAVASRYYLFGLVFFAVGLAFATRRRRFAVAAPLVLFALAAIVYAVFGLDGSIVGAALLDAGTLLVLVLLLTWLVRRTLLSRGGPVAAAGALLLALVVVAGDVRAEDAKAPAKSGAAPGRVYVPYDPDDPTVPRADDRVYLPLETYLRLRRLAHPDEDPEVARLGRIVSLVGLRHRLKVGEESASGGSTLTLAKRGDGLVLVPLPFRGLAATKAVLDGAPVRLLLEKGVYHIPLVEEGDHVLELQWRAPVARSRKGRAVSVGVPPFAGATMEVFVDDFDGDVRVDGAARIAPSPLSAPQNGRTALVHLGALGEVHVRLDDPTSAEPSIALRTRAESDQVHSIREDGTESLARVTLHVLQGEAEHVDVDLPDDVSVLAAGGAAVARWETGPGRLRLVFAAPANGRVPFEVRTWRPASGPTRTETLPDLSVREATGERGRIVVNATPTLRVEPVSTERLLRTATPRDEAARGPDKAGRVAGAWHFASRPTSFSIRVLEVPRSLSVTTSAAVAFGDDHVHSRFDATVVIDARRPLGTLVFSLPGTDAVRHVESKALDTWWVEGEGEARRLHLRYRSLMRGALTVRARLERRLGGRRDGIGVPRWRLLGATRDAGTLVLYALSDVEIAPGALPGLRSVPLVNAAKPAPPVADAAPRHAFAWERPVETSLPVVLRTPALEVEATVVAAIHPSDDVQRVEHLVLFDVTRGLTDRYQIFVPDGGVPQGNVVRTRDLREVREQRVKRRGADGREVDGTLYLVRLQAARGGIVEVTVSQVVNADRPVRVVRPEGVQATRWFGLVRAFLDGTVDVAVTGGEADPADWEDLPFLPAALTRRDVFRMVTARSPYVLDVSAERREIEQESAAVVRAAQADVVLGRDGEARVRATYRLFNRRRQFLRVRLPDRAVLYGVTAAGRPVKPLQGRQDDLLVPIPKVPLGGAGYAVAILYRAPAGSTFPTGDLEVTLPTILDEVAVDRTVVRLYVPEGFDYELDTTMTRSEREDVSADLAEAAVKEARDLLKVAEGGTLEQRALAATNIGRLVQEAQTLNRAAGEKRAGLNREVQQAQTDFNEQWKSIQLDFDAKSREIRGQRRELFASNAQSLLDYEVTDAELPVQTQQPDGPEAAGARQPGGQWRFNPTQVGQGAEKKDVKQLKERLGKALQSRARQELNPARESRPGGSVDATKQVQAGETWLRVQVPDQNFLLLNDALCVEQIRNGQLGIVAQPQAAGQAGARTAVGPDQVVLRYAENLDPSNFTPPEDLGVDARGLHPSSGLYFNDGEDGSFQGRAENVFDSSLQTALGQPYAAFGYARQASDGTLVNLDDVTNGLEDGSRGGYDWGAAAVQGPPKMRRGLMGVDVSLPRQGKVYHFRSLKTGAPIKIQVTEQGMPAGVRWVLFLALIAGLVGVVVGVENIRRTKKA